MSTTDSTNKTPDQSSELEKLVIQKVIIRAIRDLVSSDSKHVKEAEEYIYSESRLSDVVESGFSKNIATIIRKSLELSIVQRKYIVKKVLNAIKTPPKKGGNDIALAEIGVTADDSLSQNKSKSNP